MEKESLRGLFEGAVFQEPQIVIAQEGAKVMYKEMVADRGEKTKATDQQVASAIERNQAYFWAQSAWAVVYCVCRDILGMPDNMAEFERYIKKLPFTKALAYDCPEGTIQKTLLNNQYMRMSIHKWKNSGGKDRAVLLAEKLVAELDGEVVEE